MTRASFRFSAKCHFIRDDPDHCPFKVFRKIRVHGTLNETAPEVSIFSQLSLFYGLVAANCPYLEFRGKVYSKLGKPKIRAKLQADYPTRVDDA